MGEEKSSSLADIIDLAFEYRGDVSIDRVDGSAIVGYLFNRNAAGAAPYAEVIETGSGHHLRLSYNEIKNIRFTGRDTAAGASWEAWKRRKDAQATTPQSRGGSSPIASNKTASGRLRNGRVELINLGPKVR